MSTPTTENIPGLDLLTEIQTQLNHRMKRVGRALRMLEGLFSKGRLFQDDASPMFMLRNKFGLTKKDAKKLYYDVRSKDNEEGEDPKQSKTPESTEEKIVFIMETMKQTAVKLDRMEEDLAYLKDQVDKILKKL